MNENAKTAQPVREPQVELEVHKLDKSVALVENLACRVIERLDSVARSRNPDVEDEPKERPQLVELAERLYGVDQRVNNVADRLQCLLDRIEL